jgi:ABC-type transport system involved in multi-copper enzyme maturation permease subunit
MNFPLITASILTAFALLAAAIPWMSALGLMPPVRGRSLPFYLLAALVMVGVGGCLGTLLSFTSDRNILGNWGRFLFSLIHLELGLDLFVFVLFVLLRVWPKGGAVAFAAFQEGLRQPTYWFILIAGVVIMALSSILPFYTFGEDLKVLKELCFVFTMMLPTLFGVLAASISVTDEIEGRTAVTLMSKPILRRDFLLGKFAGVALAALSMTIVLGWYQLWIALFKDHIDPPIVPVTTPDPAWMLDTLALLGPGSSTDFVRGMLLWVADASDSLPGLVIGYCQVAVLTALAVALATRLPLLANLVTCLVVYLLGHLTGVLTEATANSNPIISFVAQLIDTGVPPLDTFDASQAVIRDVPLPFGQYSWYAVQVLIYGAVYTSIALLLGLILFEDRDLA